MRAGVPYKYRWRPPLLRPQGESGMLLRLPERQLPMARMTWRSLRRIINVPKRGIGATTINRGAGVRERRNRICSCLRCACRSSSRDDFPGVGKSVAKLDGFCTMMIQTLADASKTSMPSKYADRGCAGTDRISQGADVRRDGGSTGSPGQYR